jgi:hypothetical protein
MELALNLVWVGVALLGFVLLRTKLSRAAGLSAREPSNGQKIIAMTCTVVILFFVISMTDDLHEQQLAVEESRSSRVTFESATPTRVSAHPIVTNAFPLFFVPVLSSPNFSTAIKLLEPLEVSFTAAISRRSLCRRAPPALFS